MSQPLEYARGVPTDLDVAAFRQMRMIYAVGVTLIWIAMLIAATAGLSRCTDGQADNAAKVQARCTVIAGVAATWLLVGLLRVVCSSLLRRSWIAWSSLAANLLALLFLASAWA